MDSHGCKPDWGANGPAECLSHQPPCVRWENEWIRTATDPMVGPGVEYILDLAHAHDSEGYYNRLRLKHGNNARIHLIHGPA